MNSLLFVQKYQLYLPDREELRQQIELALREVEHGNGWLLGRVSVSVTRRCQR